LGAAAAGAAAGAALESSPPTAKKSATLRPSRALAKSLGQKGSTVTPAALIRVASLLPTMSIAGTVDVDALVV